MAKTDKSRSPALAYLRTSSAANVGSDKDSEKRQRNAIQGFARGPGSRSLTSSMTPPSPVPTLSRPARASHRSLTASRATACVPSSSRMPAGLRVS